MKPGIVIVTLRIQDVTLETKALWGKWIETAKRELEEASHYGYSPTR